jgi:hypothetical protein
MCVLKFDVTLANHFVCYSCLYIYIYIYIYIYTKFKYDRIYHKPLYIFTINVQNVVKLPDSDVHFYLVTSHWLLRF